MPDWGAGGPCVDGAAPGWAADESRRLRRVAAVDCGTNSLRLLIAEASAAGPTDLLRRSEIVRLGAGVDANRRIAPDALARTLAVLGSYAVDIARHGVQRRPHGCHQRHPGRGEPRRVRDRRAFGAGRVSQR